MSPLAGLVVASLSGLVVASLSGPVAAPPAAPEAARLGVALGRASRRVSGV